VYKTPISRQLSPASMATPGAIAHPGRVLKGACHHSKPTGLHPSDGPTQTIGIASTGLGAATWQHEPPTGSYILPSTSFTQIYNHSMATKIEH